MSELRLGKIPTTSVLRRISRLSRLADSGLFDQVWRHSSFGKAVNASTMVPQISRLLGGTMITVAPRRRNHAASGTQALRVGFHLHGQRDSIRDRLPQPLQVSHGRAEPPATPGEPPAAGSQAGLVRGPGRPHRSRASSDPRLSSSSARRHRQIGRRAPRPGDRNADRSLRVEPGHGDTRRDHRPVLAPAGAFGLMHPRCQFAGSHPTSGSGFPAHPGRARRCADWHGRRRAS